MLCDFHGSLDSSGFQQAAIILDASGSAEGHRRGIIDLAQQVLMALPGRMQVRLHFLGNPSPYRASDFASNAPGWFAQNARRTSLINPVFESLPQDGSMSIIVIGSGRIYDLEDWENTVLLQNTILVSLEESLQGGACLAEEMVSPSAQEVVRRVYDPTVRVEITGLGFMPAQWDNPAYALHMDEGICRLTAERSENYGLDIRCRIPTNCCPEVTVIHGSGRRTSVALQPAKTVCSDTGRSGHLTPMEMDILGAAVNRQSFVCPCCGQETAWDQVRCNNSGVIIGEAIYPSLRDIPANAFVIFRMHSAGVEFSVRACDVLSLAGDEAAVREARSTYIYRYDEASGRWERTSRPFGQYQQLGEGVHAILL